MGRRSRALGAGAAAHLLALSLATATCAVPTDPDADPGARVSSQGAPEASYAAAHPRVYLNAANTTRLRGLLADRAPAAVRFRKLVNSALGLSGSGDIYDYHAWYSALLGALTGDAKYCTDAVARVQRQVRAERRLIADGDVPLIAGDSYLEVGPRIADIALTYDWCFGAITRKQRTRWIGFANQAVWNVWHPEQAKWGGRVVPWSGWSIDNPSNNYFYSFLEATELLGLATKGENDDARRWISKFRKAKIQDLLVPTFAEQLHGGGSREGTGYGTAMRTLWWLYDVWEASTGESIDDLTSHARLSMAYLMHATVPTLDRIAPIGDHARDSTASLFDYHREYGLALAELYPDDPLTAPLRTWLSSNSVPKMTQQFEYVYDFLFGGGPTTKAPLSSLNSTYFADGVGHLFARSGWTTGATWLEYAMGPHTESHAHQDQLSFLVYDDEWLAYDPNIDSHSGLRQETSAHNLVDIVQSGDPLTQWDGTAEVLRLADDDSFTYAAADATSLYTHPSTGDEPVTKLQREVVYLKPGVVVVYDRVEADAGTSYQWLLNSPFRPTVSGGNTATWDGGRLVDRRVVPATATSKVSDLTNVDSDYLGGFRLAWSVPGGDQVEFLNVISVDGAATSIAADPQGTKDGVTISLASGGTATVRFERDSVGGTLRLTGAAGSFDGALPSGVQTLPLFAP
ncbi:heparinase II/III family protein [Nocardioides humilatus]|uniref:heparinase II/III family protein n=1 Tax=Nocardioides humilatus TaxID=2607660 RepID=UPI00165EC478|nr:heparinase II/III family protein [Nocardioides humilatus]